MKMVTYKICTDVDGKEKLLVLTFDFLIKHSRLRNCILFRLAFVVEKYFVNLTNIHVKNEKVNKLIGCDNIVVLFSKKEKAKKNLKYVHCIILWHL
jgi:hypothetical protein